MPISTPFDLATQYGNDEEHFRHVLDHLFQHAVENAGFTMVPPNFAGSELIPAEIVARLEQSDLVLCDISSLNPNVFLELGIRTALNKPVAMVKDRLTKRIPFDTATIGHYTYDESLTPWTLESQITKLTEHIKQVESAGDQNAMWKYFGMRLQAGAPPGDSGVDQRLDSIMQRLDGLSAYRAEEVPDSQSYPRDRDVPSQAVIKFLKGSGGRVGEGSLAEPPNGISIEDLIFEVENHTSLGRGYVNKLLSSARTHRLPIGRYLRSLR